MWIFYALLSAIAASLVAIFAKLGLKSLDATLATTLRSLVMFIFLFGTSLSLKKFAGFNLRMLGTQDWLFIFLAGIAGAVSWLFYFFALKLGLASKVSAVDRLSLVFVIILAALFLGEKITLKVAVGTFLMVLGAILVVFQ